MTKTNGSETPEGPEPAQNAAGERASSGLTAVFGSKPVQATLVLAILWGVISRLPSFSGEPAATTVTMPPPPPPVETAEQQVGSSLLEGETKTRPELAQPLQPELRR